LIPIGAYLYIQNKWIVEPLRIGQKIPSSVIQTFDGKNVSTDSIFMTKTIILFFSTTCPRCKNEIANLVSLCPDFKKFVNFAGISLNTESETKKFLTEINIPFSIYIDPKKEAQDNFHVLLVPAMFFVNEKQLLVKYKAGEESKERLKMWLTRFARLHIDSNFAQ
ncbi:MAG: redoxin domain-containing protein, partial [Bacteroidota bacterium]|nr:redoxin domain-containing protein [Bacteroidota bacterium]